MPNDARSPASDTLAHIPPADFVAAWRTIVGEPPAVLLPSRSEMIRILVESMPVASARIDEPAPCASQQRSGRTRK
jgi:hypothetical protein